MKRIVQNSTKNKHPLGGSREFSAKNKRGHFRSCSRKLFENFFWGILHTLRITSAKFRLSTNFFPFETFHDRTNSPCLYTVTLIKVRILSFKWLHMMSQSCWYSDYLSKLQVEILTLLRHNGNYRLQNQDLWELFIGRYN